MRFPDAIWNGRWKFANVVLDEYVISFRIAGQKQSFQAEAAIPNRVWEREGQFNGNYSDLLLLELQERSKFIARWNVLLVPFTHAR